MGNALVLVIDDDDFILSQLRRVLHGRFQVVSARSVEEGLQALELAVPSVVLCDESLPGFDLATLINLLRSAFGQASIVLMSERIQDCEVRARTGGADAFLPKPFLRSDLIALVSSFVDGTIDKSIAA